MKKLLVSLVAAALLALGLVGISSSPAQADCPYSGCIQTTTTKIGGPNTVEKGSSATFKIKVTPNGANGSVMVTCHKRHSDYSVSGSDALNDNNVAHVTVGPFMKRGKYRCVAHYERHGRFLGSSDHFRVRVVR